MFKTNVLWWIHVDDVMGAEPCGVCTCSCSVNPCLICVYIIVPACIVCFVHGNSAAYIYVNLRTATFKWDVFFMCEFFCMYIDWNCKLEAFVFLRFPRISKIAWTVDDWLLYYYYLYCRPSWSRDRPSIPFSTFTIRATVHRPSPRPGGWVE